MLVAVALRRGVVLSTVLVLVAAAGARAQSRGPVMPSFQDNREQNLPAAAAAPAPAPAAPAPAPAESIELVGQTPGQIARAKEAAAAKAKADAEAKSRAEAEAMKQAEADAKAAVELKKLQESEAKLKADEEARERLALELKAKADAVDLARAQADEKAKADAAKAQAVELKKQEAVVAAGKKAHARDEQKCLKAGNTKAVAKCKTAVAAKYSPKSLPLPQMAALPAAPLHPADGGAVALPLEPLVSEEAPVRRVIAPAGSTLQPAATIEAAPALAEKSARATPVPAAAPAPVAPAPVAPAPVAPAAAAYSAAPAPVAAAPAGSGRALVRPNARTDSSDRALAKPAVASGSNAQPSASPASLRSGSTGSTGSGGGLASSRTLSPAQTVVPRDEGGSRSRHIDLSDEAQIGPSSLVLNRLTARGELVPDSVQASFGYRFAIDEASAAHHLFAVGVESSRCEAGISCGALWFLNAGYSPQSDSTFAVVRSNPKPVNATDQLGWSATTAAAGLGYSGKTYSFLADGQFEELNAQYLKNVGNSPTRTSSTIDQLRLRATLAATGGGFTAAFRLAGYAYPGKDASTVRGVPLRGALIDDDLGGLAIAPQGFLARVEGRYESAGGFGAQLSYGYLGYAGADWQGAHLIGLGLSQRLGRFHLGVGLAIQEEVPTLMPASASAGDYSTVFGTGTLGASF